MKGKRRKNRFYTKDFVYLADFFLNIGVLVFIFFQSYKVSGTMLGGILTDKGIMVIAAIMVDILVIICQILYLIGRLMRKEPDDMTIVSHWPSMWILGKSIILAGTIAAYFLGVNMISIWF